MTTFEKAMLIVVLIFLPNVPLGMLYGFYIGGFGAWGIIGFFTQLILGFSWWLAMCPICLCGYYIVASAVVIYVLMSKERVDEFPERNAEDMEK